MTQTPKHKLKRGCPVIMPSGLVTELTDIQYEHNRYQIEGVSGWQYGIENLQPAEWKLEAQKWRREAMRKYPTPEAYEAACTALEKHRARADAAEAREQRLKEALEELLSVFTLHSTWASVEDYYGSIYSLTDTDSEIVLRINSFLSLYPDTPAPTTKEVEK